MAKKIKKSKKAKKISRKPVRGKKSSNKRKTLKKAVKKQKKIKTRPAKEKAASIVRRPVENKLEEVRKTKIKLIGIGGGGGSIISEIASRIKRADFIVANTDQQALKFVPKYVKRIQFGKSLTQGLGCGMDWKVGQKAAQQDREKIAKLFEDTDMAILISCLGGGAGSGATAEFARIAKEMNVITFGIFTMPFKFEGDKKYQVAKKAIERISPSLNVFQIFPNELIFKIIDKSTPFQKAFSAVNKKILDNIEGLIETIYLPGLINIDFADVQAILDGKGKLAYLNNAEAEGSNRAEEAVKKLVLSPLNEYVLPDDSEENGSSFEVDKVLYNICAGKDLGMKEVEQISRAVYNFNKKAKIIFGISQDAKYDGRIKITLLATGEMNRKPKNKKEKAKKDNDSTENTDSAIRIPAMEDEKEEVLPNKSQKTTVKKKNSKINSPKSKKKQAKIPAKRQLNLKPVREKVALAKKLSKRPAKKGLVRGLIKPLINVSKKAVGFEAPNQQYAEAVSTNLKIRRTALDLKHEAEETEKKMLEEEKKWDIPAFLRRRQENNG